MARCYVLSQSVRDYSSRGERPLLAESCRSMGKLRGAERTMGKIDLNQRDTC